MTLAQITPSRSAKVMPAARAQDSPQEPALDPASANSNGSPYQRLLHSLHNDQKWQTEVNLGKRAGFYRFRGELGSGNFSQVKMAVHQLTKEQVAIKILDKSKLEQKTRKMLSREIATMEAIHHPNIIRLYEVVETYSKIYLVMEYARGGELFNKITSSGRFSEAEAKPLFAQVISAVEYMHDHNFIHRDIKAENVFYATPSLVKLGDFGFSTQLTTGADQQLNTFCGSPPYAAPELFRDESYLGGPVDVWALGVLLYFMVTAQIPFKAQTVASLKKHILDGSFTVPSYVSLPCRVLIEGILRQCPQERLTFTQIHNSEWLKGVGFPVQPGPTENYTLGPTMLPRCVPDDELGKDGRRSSRSESLTGRRGSYPLGRLSDMEIGARARLAELGITSTLLEEHEGRGVRSAVIGTYRIVVHRIQRQAMAASNTDTKVNEDANSTALPHSANTSANHHFCLSALGRRTKSAKPPASKSGKGNRSRTCTLL